MDQAAFRQLVASSAGGSKLTSRGSLLPSRPAKKSEPSTSSKSAPAKPEFKPRKFKESNYRDRAAERRHGVADDFAQAEAVLANFEKQHAEDDDRKAVDEKRQYLGGDAEHTILVKGLDYALLEQTKAKLAANSAVDDDESLENAFRAGTSDAISNPTKGKKRTREDLIRELKEKRGKNGGGTTQVPEEDDEKKDSKFKPIGFKPVGGSAKKLKEKEGSKKKKRKVEVDALNTPNADPPSNLQIDDAELPSTSKLKQEPPPEPIDDEDIFADAGEYDGLQLDDNEEERKDEDEEEEGEVRGRGENDSVREPPSDKRWFDDVDEPRKTRATPDPPKARDDRTSHRPERHSKQTEPRPLREEEQPERRGRLAPLQSSSVPSVRDILAADEALVAEELRKARKEKRKAGAAWDGGDDEGVHGGGGRKKKVSAETKLNREYKKLQAYTEKKNQQ